ncbi:DUF493 family protein [Pseudodesulfovibrio tunisiensis]|uniref:DUF493 family protein n=1 Tax=Pseudodesulfovibrio tunisiensis TaxID=463192 RepID=UPI001FB55076|nr:DUF493 family protein [Pseudodesulfovibrio tunisiensis]
MEKHEQFQQILDEHHDWPCPYTFKFIVPAHRFDQFNELFSEFEMSTRTSRTGKYTSITMESTMCSSTEVMSVYTKAAMIKGIISL